MSQESELALLARRSEGLWPDVQEVKFFSHFVFSFGAWLVVSRLRVLLACTCLACACLARLSLARVCTRHASIRLDSWLPCVIITSEEYSVFVAVTSVQSLLP